MVSKKQYGIACRDFYDKVIQFVHEGTIYKYVSTVSDSEKHKPSPDKETIRCVNYFSITKIKRNPSDSKISYTVIGQNDPKIEIPKFIMDSVLPSSSKTWMTGAMKHYNKNHKNL